MFIEEGFFDADAAETARNMLGKVLCRKTPEGWRFARIIETEAYYLAEKGSHASLGFTHKRRALFMVPGTIYMYHSRGGDSLNVSCRGEGNAVLIKSAAAHLDNSPEILKIMSETNPIVNRVTGEKRSRPFERLCSGQALLCRSLCLRAADWDARRFNKNIFFIEDRGYKPSEILIRPRLGIPAGRDEHLPLRFLDGGLIRSSTLGR